MRLLSIFITTLLSFSLGAQPPFTWQQALDSYSSAVSYLTLSPEEHYLLGGYENGQVGVWETEDMNQSVWLNAHEGKVSHVALSIQKRLLLTAGYDGKIKVWHFPEAQLLSTFHNPSIGPYGSWQGDEATFALFVPNRDAIVYRGYNGQLMWGDLETSQASTLYQNYHGGLTSAAWLSPDSLVVGASQQIIGINPHSAQVIFEWRSREGVCELLPTTPATVWVWTYQGRLQRWHKGILNHQFKATPQQGSAEFGISREAGWIVTGQRNDEALVWKLGQNQLLQRLQKHQAAVTCIALNSAGTALFTADEAGTIHCWQNTSEPLSSLPPARLLNDPSLPPIDVQATVTVHARQIQLLFWDDRQYDQDTVSLSLNDRWVSRRTVLRKMKRKLDLSLKPGNNLLILKAHNVGRIPPNTAAVRIDDGSEQHTIQLHSDRLQSGALRIVVEEPNN